MKTKKTSQITSQENYLGKREWVENLVITVVEETVFIVFIVEHMKIAILTQILKRDWAMDTNKMDLYQINSIKVKYKKKDRIQRQMDILILKNQILR